MTTARILTKLCLLLTATALWGCESPPQTASVQSSSETAPAQHVEVPSKSPGEIARDVFDPDDPLARRNAIAILRYATYGGEEPYVKLYRLMVDDPEFDVREQSVLALGQHGDETDIQLLKARIKDSSKRVRTAAYWSIAKIKERHGLSP